MVVGCDEKKKKYRCDDFQDSVFREEGCEESIKKARRIANLARCNHDVDRFVGEEICVDVEVCSSLSILCVLVWCTLDKVSNRRIISTQ